MLSAELAKRVVKVKCEIVIFWQFQTHHIGLVFNDDILYSDLSHFRLQTLNEALTSGDQEKAKQAFLNEVY